jgi:hypothetical protein
MLRRRVLHRFNHPVPMMALCRALVGSWTNVTGRWVLIEFEART